MFKMTITAVLESDDGVMCEQTTTWRAMDQGEMLTLETSYLEWLASLPNTIGAETVSTKKR